MRRKKINFRVSSNFRRLATLALRKRLASGASITEPSINQVSESTTADTTSYHSDLPFEVFTEDYDMASDIAFLGEEE